MQKVYVKNSTGILKKVLLCPPDYIKFYPINVITERWMELGETADKEGCMREHKEFVQAFKENDVEVVMMEPKEGITNEVFARDFGACIKEGYILGRFKEHVRREETDEYEQKMKELGIPCVYKCKEGIFEGGDFWLLDEHTIAIGVVARTDMTGINEIKKALGKLDYEVIPVRCPNENLHLDMCFNIVEEKLAVICSEALPEEFINILKKRKYTLIDVPQEGVFKHYCNVQALGRGRVISASNNKEVASKLKSLGIEVTAVDLTQILKNGGGPHCMTFPLERI
ncbi:dimethylarginine dimethylaminohydrolase family protein [Clostridium oryzae]|uniref:N(G),N(G)-dimethylarginine dimethylaminohydrolase n=1 Tax=Clostridium oryzae TaxID=1450648 RepID=A0A1V4IHK6_9CLOT|nr:dimethylarginine dimethylaminohydrolase family protein [Clostridium oryzae]OPJ59340.1 N(G),N(G)-dimethylarginine dimethylaminohydrolase [Clostridium oryzae]